MKIEKAEFVKGTMGTDEVLYNGVPQVAFVGRSNVGKSSVINSITRKGLAKEGKKPGKTMELNIFSINNGKYYLIDLPGYGYAKGNPKLKEKILKLIYWYINDSGIKPLKIVIVLDVKAGLTEFDKETIGMLEKAGHPYILVVNKIDKLNKKELAEKIKTIKERANEAEIVEYSAEKKIGTDKLLTKIFGG